jgi:hypothetical protein
LGFSSPLPSSFSFRHLSFSFSQFGFWSAFLPLDSALFQAKLNGRFGNASRSFRAREFALLDHGANHTVFEQGRGGVVGERRQT